MGFYFVGYFFLSNQVSVTRKNTPPNQTHKSLTFFPFFVTRFFLAFFFALIYGNDCSHTVYILYPNGVPQKFHFFCIRSFLFDAHPQSIFWRKRCYSDISIQSKSKTKKKKFPSFLVVFFVVILFYFIFQAEQKYFPEWKSFFFLFCCSCLGRARVFQCILVYWMLVLCAFNAPSGFSLKIVSLVFCIFLFFFWIFFGSGCVKIVLDGTSGARKIHQLQHKVSLNCHFSITHQKKHQLNVEIFLSRFFAHRKFQQIKLLFAFF